MTRMMAVKPAANKLINWIETVREAETKTTRLPGPSIVTGIAQDLGGAEDSDAQWSTAGRH